jgi:collagenase-like PrtC family protease
MLIEGRTDPSVYVYRISDDWSQLILCNNHNEPHTVTTPLSGDQADTGSLGHDPDATYYLHDFWNDKFLGEISGKQSIEQTLKPQQALTYSLHRKKDHPQFLSTNRHIMQGMSDLADVKWDAETLTYSGSAKLIGGEPFVITLANNGHTATKVTASTGQATLATTPEKLTRLTIRTDANNEVKWTVTWVKAPSE